MPSTCIGSNWHQELLQYWFETLGPDDWFNSSRAVDASLREKFADTLLAQGGRPANEFLSDPATARAAILLFDQLPRNLFRGTAQAFAYDPLSLVIARAFLANSWDKGLNDHQRHFAAMPLMHSEELADQEASVAYFRRHLPDIAPFAESHHAMIARFGRFPHRNIVLGRETTEEEQAAIDDGFSW